jgi:hypothetical protein
VCNNWMGVPLWAVLRCCGFASDLLPLFLLCSCYYYYYYSAFPSFHFLPSQPWRIHSREESSFILFHNRNSGFGQRLLRIVSKSHCVPLRKFQRSGQAEAQTKIPYQSLFHNCRAAAEWLRCVFYGALRVVRSFLHFRVAFFLPV